LLVGPIHPLNIGCRIDASNNQIVYCSEAPILSYSTGKTVVFDTTVVYRSPGAESIPVSELAILHLIPRNASIHKIDGELHAVATVRKLELMPGTRSISTYLVSGYAPAGGVTMKFKALAGVEYELKAMHNDKDWHWESWIVRKGTDKVVSVEESRW